MCSPIVVSWVCGHAMVYNAKDYISLRENHRICGNLIGSTASFPNDLSLKGLPAVYNGYQTRLLVEENIIQLVDKSEKISQEPDAEQNSAYQNYLAVQKEEQSKRWTNHQRPMNDSDLYYHVPFQSPIQTGRIVNADEIDVDPLKYRIFKDLWKSGYYLTMASSFGGDFLVYEGDPIIVHAKHIVHVLSSPSVPSMEFIRNNRLSVGVKKNCIFAYFNPETDSIEYQLTKWDSSWQ